MDVHFKWECPILTGTLDLEILLSWDSGICLISRFSFTSSLASRLLAASNSLQPSPSVMRDDQVMGKFGTSETWSDESAARCTTCHSCRPSRGQKLINIRLALAVIPQGWEHTTICWVPVEMKFLKSANIEQGRRTRMEKANQMGPDTSSRRGQHQKNTTALCSSRSSSWMRKTRGSPLWPFWQLISESRSQWRSFLRLFFPFCTGTFNIQTDVHFYLNKVLSFAQSVYVSSFFMCKGGTRKK